MKPQQMKWRESIPVSVVHALSSIPGQLDVDGLCKKIEIQNTGPAQECCSPQRFEMKIAVVSD